jgi:hypothetical protein
MNYLLLSILYLTLLLVTLKLAPTASVHVTVTGNSFDIITTTGVPVLADLNWVWVSSPVWVTIIVLIILLAFAQYKGWIKNRNK